jgi:hypothetical protein
MEHRTYRIRQEEGRKSPLWPAGVTGWINESISFICIETEREGSASERLGTPVVCWSLLVTGLGELLFCEFCELFDTTLVA